MAEYYVKIRNEKIIMSIRNYKNASKIKMYFKNQKLIVTKPKKVSINAVIQLINEKEEELYTMYKKSIQKQEKYEKKWQTGEEILYKGEEYQIIRIGEDKERFINIDIDEQEKQIKIVVPAELKDSDLKTTIDKGIKQLFKNNTYAMLQYKLPYWSKETGIQYKEFNVRDAVSKYGSCVPAKQKLHFSSRLIMLPENAVDAIIVHELCHMVYHNHSKQFYDLVKKYKPDYERN